MWIYRLYYFYPLASFKTSVISRWTQLKLTVEIREQEGTGNSKGLRAIYLYWLQSVPFFYVRLLREKRLYVGGYAPCIRVNLSQNPCPLWLTAIQGKHSLNRDISLSNLVTKVSLLPLLPLLPLLLALKLTPMTDVRPENSRH